jgi:hypothetical protein
LHDHVEWAVHLYLTGADDEPTTRPTSGTDFFRQKVTAATRKEQSRAAREARVRDAYAMLADLSRQSVANPPQDPALSGRREPMLLNSAHLVCRRHESLFFAAVEDYAPTWQRRLDALHGQVELLVHVQVDGEAQRSDGETGRSYLRRRSAVLGARDRAVQAVGTILGAWPHQLRPLPDGKRVAVLVGREVTAPARTALEAWAADQPDIGIVVTGPWPPFSFSEDLGA